MRERLQHVILESIYEVHFLGWIFHGESFLDLPF